MEAGTDAEWVATSPRAAEPETLHDSEGRNNRGKAGVDIETSTVKNNQHADARNGDHSSTTTFNPQEFEQRSCNGHAAKDGKKISSSTEHWTGSNTALLCFRQFAAVQKAGLAYVELGSSSTRLFGQNGQPLCEIGNPTIKPKKSTLLAEVKTVSSVLAKPSNVELDEPGASLLIQKIPP